MLHGHAAEDVSRDKPAKENPAALRRNKEIPGPTTGQEIETARRIPLARDHCIGEEVALGCGSQDGIEIAWRKPFQERRTQVGSWCGTRKSHGCSHGRHVKPSVQVDAWGLSEVPVSRYSTKTNE